MNTSSVVTQIQRMNPDWTRAQILDVINDTVKLLLKVERDESIYFDPTTGNLPYLTTTSGTYLYTVTIPGITIWKIRGIVTDLTDLPTFDPTIQSYGKTNMPVSLNGLTYNQVPCTPQDEASTGTAGLVKVLFSQDPGSYSTRYRIMAYESPAEILSETVPIPINDSLKMSVVIPAVQTMVDAFDNGRYQEAVAYVESLQPKLLTDRDVDPIFTNSYTY